MMGKKFLIILGLLFFVGPVLSSCGTCIGCNGKLFDLNAGETYKKKVAAEKTQELQQCKSWNYKPGTAQFLDCLKMFEAKRQKREDDSLRRSQAIGRAFGNMRQQIVRPPAPSPVIRNSPDYRCTTDGKAYGVGVNRRLDLDCKPK